MQTFAKKCKKNKQIDINWKYRERVKIIQLNLGKYKVLWKITNTSRLLINVPKNDVLYKLFEPIKIHFYSRDSIGCPQSGNNHNKQILKKLKLLNSSKLNQSELLISVFNVIF